MQVYFSKILSILLLAVVLFSCSESNNNDDNNCTKTITIPQFYLVGNQSYSYDIEQEVPCDFEEPSEPILIDNPPVLENFNYQVISFEFIADTGNDTTSLEMEILLNNNNDFDVTGVPVFTMSSGDIEFTGTYTNNATEPCLSISANSSCTFVYQLEESNISKPPYTTMELIDIKYYLTN